MGNRQPIEQEEEHRGWWTRVRERIWGADEEDAAEEAIPEARRRMLRLETARRVHVALRFNATVFNDARAAADGLKMGQQQIVNLEQASQHVAERIVDFLSGVTYALDGSVERIGERVFLFAPANFEIEIEGEVDTAEEKAAR
jgi:cell division inhibitor SepF